MESYEILWNSTLKELEKTVSTISYQTYITKLSPIDFVENKIVLYTTNDFFAKEIAGRLAKKIREALHVCNPAVSDFELYVGQNKEDYFLQIESKNKQTLQGSPVIKEFTFDSFVVGQSNEYIYAASKAVAENPGEIYNPLFIYGGTGLGKTHILMAIVNYLKIHNPSLNVLYSTCEQFTNQLIECISRGEGKGADFRNKYRNVDVLLIDDVQFLAGKKGVQTEFFHTFNELIMQNKQIVLASDRSPSEIEVLEDRLRTRFESGLLADVQTPDLETRIAILNKKAHEMKTIVDMKVLTFLAETGSEDIRSLIGKLKKVIFASKLHGKPITIELASEALKEAISPTQEEVKAEDIISCVSTFYKISKQDLLGKKKNKEFVEPRQICIYLIYELMSLPLVTIGQKMGGRDHSTVIYARDKIADLIQSNPEIAIQVNDIKNMILKK